MPGGRPSKISTSVTLPAVEGIGPERELPITDAICLLLEHGSYPTNAAKACGISENTLTTWLKRGASWQDADPEQHDPEDVEANRAYVEFLSRATRAEALGLVWHEVNVRRSASAAHGRDGRLSLEFLARRQPNVYSKRIEFKADPTERKPEAIDVGLAAAAAESFAAAALPPGLSPDDFLPDVTTSEVEADAEAPA